MIKNILVHEKMWYENTKVFNLQKVEDSSRVRENRRLEKACFCKESYLDDGNYRQKE